MIRQTTTEKRETARAIDSEVVASNGGGLTIREWFAGQALAGLLANQTFLLRILDKHECENPQQAAAKVAFEMADEMMIEGKK